MNDKIKAELERYNPDERTLQKTINNVVRHIKDGFSLEQAKKMAHNDYQRERMREKWKKADTTEDDAYMKKHLESLNEKVCSCILGHGEDAKAGELCETCQIDYNRVVEENDRQNATEIV